MTVTKVKSRESKYADGLLSSNEYNTTIGVPANGAKGTAADYSVPNTQDSSAYTALMGASNETPAKSTAANGAGLNYVSEANNEDDKKVGALTYNDANGVYSNIWTDTHWKYDENGNTVNTDKDGNPIDSQTNALGANEPAEPIDVPIIPSSDDTKETDTPDDETSDTPFDSQEETINEQYDALEDAAKTEAEQAYEQGKSKYEQDLIAALPEYQKQREQQDYLTKQNENKIKEYAFYTGDTGGMSRQDILQNVNSGQESIRANSLQQQMLEDDTDRAIADLFSQNKADLAVALSQIRAERLAALEDERVRLQESNAQWQQWVTSQTGYMPDGSPTAKQQAYLSTLIPTTDTAQITGYTSTSSGKTSTAKTALDAASSGTENQYTPMANSTGTHAQYYQDENGNLVWQPYYTNDEYKTTPADYAVPDTTDDPVSWIINSAASYPKSDGAEIMSPINDAMAFNNLMSYIGANYNDLSEADKARLLNNTGLSEEYLLSYFSVN